MPNKSTQNWHIAECMREIGEQTSAVRASIKSETVRELIGIIGMARRMHKHIFRPHFPISCEFNCVIFDTRPLFCCVSYGINWLLSHIRSQPERQTVADIWCNLADVAGKQRKLTTKWSHWKRESIVRDANDWETKRKCHSWGLIEAINCTLTHTGTQCEVRYAQLILIFNRNSFPARLAHVSCLQSSVCPCRLPIICASHLLPRFRCISSVSHICQM